MANDLEITSTANLMEIEQAILRLPTVREAEDGLTARISSDRYSTYFKDIWCAMAVATFINLAPRGKITAWGLQNWSKQDDEDGFALSLPGITGLQFGADVQTDGRFPESLDPALVRRHIRRSDGVLGTGARQRTVVELEPDLPTATPLMGSEGGRDAFFEYVRRILKLLEIGAMARKTEGLFSERAAKGTILEFLYELQANAVEHGRAARNVRFLRLQKHLYPSRNEALGHAANFAELTDYLTAQRERPSNRMFNLIETSVSDFGPGIIDGFLATFAGEVHRGRQRPELLLDLLHKQLSSKRDPNAGLGISNALAAAREMDAFVSLRTGEFWLVMRGQLDKQPHLSFRAGEFASIPGTHWQLLLPDRTEAADGDLFGA